MITFRDYQVGAIDAVFSEWEKGILSTLIMACTGAGKTEMALGVLARAYKAGATRFLAIAHLQELIYQPRDRVIAHWQDQLPVPGVVMADEDDKSAEFVVGSVQTLKEKRLRACLDYGAFTHLWIDECFPAGTLVDDRPIETIKEEDSVTAFDQLNDQFTRSRVNHVFVRPVRCDLARIRTESGREVATTINHPFLVLSANGQEWLPAGLIQANDFVAVKGERHAEAKICRKSDLYAMRSFISSGQVAKNPICNQGTMLLFKRMWQSLYCDSFGKNHGRNESEICVCQDEDKEPNEQPRNSGTHESDFEANWAQAKDSGRQWSWPKRTSEIVGGGIGLGDGIHFSYKASQRVRVPVPLQDRYCKSISKNCYRNRRSVAFRLGEKGKGRQEGGVIDWERVESIEIFKRGSDPRFRELCPSGVVYNLEIDRFHTYTANGFVVHNCHHSVSPTYKKLIDILKEANPNIKIFGVTATPLRTDKAGLGEIFESCAYRFPIDKGIKAGALCPFVGIGIELPVDFSGVPEKGKNGWDDEEAGRLLSLANVEEVIIENWKKHAGDRKTIVFTSSVAQAYSLAAAYRAAGFTAEAIDGDEKRTPPERRIAVLSRFKSGETQIICNMKLLSEGVDIPDIACVVMAKPTKSDLVYIQSAGRGLRIAPGKKDCIILDFAPRNARNMRMAGDLLGKPRKIKEKEQKLADKGVILDCFGVNRDGESIEGNPDEVETKILDYLGSSHLAWTYDGQVSTVSIAPAISLAIIAPQLKRIEKANQLKSAGQWFATWEDEYRRICSYQVYAVENNRIVVQIGSEPDWQGASYLAADYADLHAEQWLSERAKRWRNKPTGEKQAQLCKRLGVWREGMRCGEASQAITHALTIKTLQRNGILRGP